MSKTKLVISELGIDGWILGLTALVAITIGILDFTPLITITPDPALRMILVALGLVMGAIVAQTGRRTIEMKELRDSLGATSVELLRLGKESQFHVQQSISRARRFVLDTTLHRQLAQITHPADDRTHYHSTIYERVQKGEISYRKIEGIFGKERFEYVISRLLVYEGTDYSVRYFASPAKPIPVLNMMSVDNETFYLGAFYTGDAPAETENLAYIKNPQIGSLLETYWNNLWHSAKPLTVEGRINWDELKAIANLFEMNEEEFNSIVNKWKDEVQRRKRRTR